MARGTPICGRRVALDVKRAAEPLQPREALRPREAMRVLCCFAVPLARTKYVGEQCTYGYEQNTHLSYVGVYP